MCTLLSVYVNPCVCPSLSVYVNSCVCEPLSVCVCVCVFYVILCVYVCVYMSIWLCIIRVSAYTYVRELWMCVLYVCCVGMCASTLSLRVCMSVSMYLSPPQSLSLCVYVCVLQLYEPDRIFQSRTRITSRSASRSTTFHVSVCLIWLFNLCVLIYHFM